MLPNRENWFYGNWARTKRLQLIITTFKETSRTLLRLDCNIDSITAIDTFLNIVKILSPSSLHWSFNCFLCHYKNTFISFLATAVAVWSNNKDLFLNKKCIFHDFIWESGDMYIYIMGMLIYIWIFSEKCSENVACTGFQTWVPWCHSELIDD